MLLPNEISEENERILKQMYDPLHLLVMVDTLEANEILVRGYPKSTQVWTFCLFVCSFLILSVWISCGMN